jgi:hypothetical protein
MPEFLADDPVRILNSGNDRVILMSGKAQSQFSMSDNHGNDRIVLNGTNSALFMRAKKKPGQLLGDLVMHLDGDTGNLFLGGGNTEADVVLFPVGANIQKAEEATIHLNAGTSVILMRSGGQETIRIDGTKGDIILANADCAEEFEVDQAHDVEPGSVVVLNPSGKLTATTTAYDKRVVGVVSGAGNLRPGVVLDRRVGSTTRRAVALIGKVNCRVDADIRPVEIGDLLTSSETRGYAMKAERTTEAFGAIIGKALSPLSSGCGLIPILVTLQ